MCEIGTRRCANADVTDLSTRIADPYSGAHAICMSTLGVSPVECNIDDTYAGTPASFCSRQLLLIGGGVSLGGELSGTISALQLARRKVAVRLGYHGLDRLIG